MTAYQLDILDEKEKEMEKLEARSVGRQSVAGLSARHMMKESQAAK